jgi:hypothetical protein
MKLGSPFLENRVLDQFSWLPSLYCTSSDRFVIPINQIDTPPVPVWVSRPLERSRRRPSTHRREGTWQTKLAVFTTV